MTDRRRTGAAKRNFRSTDDSKTTGVVILIDAALQFVDSAESGGRSSKRA